MGRKRTEMKYVRIETEDAVMHYANSQRIVSTEKLPLSLEKFKDIFEQEDFTMLVLVLTDTRYRVTAIEGEAGQAPNEPGEPGQEELSEEERLERRVYQDINEGVDVSMWGYGYINNVLWEGRDR